MVPNEVQNYATPAHLLFGVEGHSFQFILHDINVE